MGVVNKLAASTGAVLSGFLGILLVVGSASVIARGDYLLAMIVMVVGFILIIFARQLLK